MSYIVRGAVRVRGAGEVLARDAAFRFVGGAAFFFALPATFAFATGAAFFFVRAGDFRFVGMLVSLHSVPCLGLVDGDLGQCSEGLGLPLDGREHELARAFGEIESEGRLMALG